MSKDHTYPWYVHDMTDWQRAALLQSDEPTQEYVLNAPATFTIDGRDFTLTASSEDPITIRVQGGVLVAGGMTGEQAAEYDALRFASEVDYLRTGSGGLTPTYLADLGIRPQQGGQVQTPSNTPRTVGNAIWAMGKSIVDGLDDWATPGNTQTPREMTDEERAALLQSGEPTQDYVLNAPATFTLDGKNFTLNASSEDPITIRVQGGVLVAGGMTGEQAAEYDALRFASEVEYLRTGSGGLTPTYLADLGIRPQQGGQVPAKTRPQQSTLMVSDEPTQDYVVNAPTTFTIDGKDFTLNASSENPIAIRVQRGVLVAGGEMTGGQAAEFDALRIASESEYVQTGEGSLTPTNLAALGIRPQQGLELSPSHGGQVLAALNAPGDASEEQLDRLAALEERVRRLQAATGRVAPPEFDAGHTRFPSPELARLHEAHRQLAFIENEGVEQPEFVNTIQNETAIVSSIGTQNANVNTRDRLQTNMIVADVVDIASITPYRDQIDAELNALDGRLSRLEGDDQTLLHNIAQFVAEPTTGGPPANNISSPPPILNEDDQTLVAGIAQFVAEPTTGGPPVNNIPSPPPILPDPMKQYSGDVPMIYVNAATTLSTVGMGSFTTQQRNGQVITGSMIGWKDSVPGEGRDRRANGYLPTDAIPIDFSGVPADRTQVTISAAPEQQLRISASDAARSGDQGMTVNVIDASTGRPGGKVAIVVQPGEQVQIQQNQQYQGHPGNWTAVRLPDGRRLFLDSETELTVQTQRSGTLRSGEVTEQTVAQYMAGQERDALARNGLAVGSGPNTTGPVVPTAGINVARTATPTSER